MGRFAQLCFARLSGYRRFLLSALATESRFGRARIPVSVRSFSSESSGNTADKGDTRIDEWFASIVKDQAFYDKQSSAGSSHRCYFYNIDLQGRLFLEETLPKNIATSIKDTKFLDFFYSRIQRIDGLGGNDTIDANVNKERIRQDAVASKIQAIAMERGIPLADYPFVSLCGKEINFIRPAATPIVFHTLLWKDKNEGEDKTTQDAAARGGEQVEPCLLWAGELSQPFEEDSLRISAVSGRLYHRFQQNKHKSVDKDQEQNASASFCLIRSAVAVALSDRMIPMDGDNADSGSGIAIQLHDGSLLPIPLLPAHAEPGTWSMPVDGPIE